MKIFNTRVYGLEDSKRISGFPMRTEYENKEDEDKQNKRAKTLGNAKIGSGHSCFLKGILVNFEMEYTIYWSPQMQRYHHIDFISSSSSMHTIKKGFDNYNKYVDQRILDVVNELISEYNENQTKENFMKIVSNLPQGQIKFAGMTTNYLQLQNMYAQRKNHKLYDWLQFCAWCESLPEFVDLCLKGERKFTNENGEPISDVYAWR